MTRTESSLNDGTPLDDALAACADRERYRRELGANGIDYQLLDTNRPLELALLSYLSTRSRSY